MGKRPCCSKVGLNKGAWTRQEDKILTDYINRHGEGSWNNLPKLAGLKRCGKSCRLRWVNYLRPDVKRGNISQDEEDLIIRMHRLLGNRWSLIAGRLPGRTDNEIKNYWNTTLKKKLDPEQLSKVAFVRKLSRGKKRKKALEPQNIVESSQVVQPIRTKALRITSKIQTLVPAKFQCPGTAAEHEESEGSSGDRRSTEDRDQPREVAGLDGIDSCYLRDGPQMNDDINIGTSADHDYDNSHPNWDGQGLEDWLICGNANFNEFITGSFEDNLGELDFGSLATLF